MTLLGGLLLLALGFVLLAVCGSLLFPSGIGENDGRCGDDAAVSRARSSAIRSAWMD